MRRKMEFSKTNEEKMNTLTLSNFSTKVQLAWAKSAGLSSVVDRLAELRLAAAAAALLELNVGGLPSIEISLVRHLEPFLKRRKLLPLFFSLLLVFANGKDESIKLDVDEMSSDGMQKSRPFQEQIVY